MIINPKKVNTKRREREKKKQGKYQTFELKYGYHSTHCESDLIVQRGMSLINCVLCFRSFTPTLDYSITLGLAVMLGLKYVFYDMEKDEEASAVESEEGKVLWLVSENFYSLCD